MAEETAQKEQNILKQVEYYFSKENLQNDTFLVSKMNPQMFVPLDVVAGFKMLKSITDDVELIRKVVKSSSKLQVEESNGVCLIRPIFAVGSRKTIVLRDRENTIPEEVIKSIFPNQDSIVSAKPDIGDTWFITFKSEPECIAAFEAVQEKEFQGKEVKARIKSENLLKNFLPAQPHHDAPQPVFPPVNFSPFPAAMPVPYPFFVRGPFGVGPMMMAPPPNDFSQVAAQPQAVSNQNHQQHQHSQDGGRGQQKGRGGGGGGGGNNANTRTPYFNRGRMPSGVGGRGQGNNSGNNSGNNNNSNTGGSQKSPGPKRGSQAGAKPAPKLGPSDFPPLPSSPQPTGGYDKEFIKYSKQEIISVLTSLQHLDVPLPADLPKDCSAIVDKINREIELTTPAKNGAAQATEEEVKSYAEAVITAKDIKPPEKPRRNSSKKGQSPYVQAGRGNQSKRGSRNSRNKRPEGTKPQASEESGETPPEQTQTE